MSNNAELNQINHYGVDGIYILSIVLACIVALAVMYFSPFLGVSLSGEVPSIQRA